MRRTVSAPLVLAAAVACSEDGARLEGDDPGGSGVDVVIRLEPEQVAVEPTVIDFGEVTLGEEARRAR